MTSEPPEPFKGKLIEAAISGHAEKVSESSQSENDLADRIERLELAIEQIGKADQHISAVSDYIRAQTNEFKEISTIRWWWVSFAGIVVFVLFLSIIFVLTNGLDGFAKLAPIAQGVLIASAFTVILTIILGVLRGVFKTPSERNKEATVPPHIAELLDSIGNVKDIAGG